ncbi:MAG: hypothetical protein M1833_000332 [Piccolia ochrophora]|nr:MAG: hypothetical protein M1833_000332 [Piccolia ochrophora]
MADRRVTNVTYGHLGRPVYDSAARKWHFARQPGLANQLKPLGVPETVFAASAAREQTDEQTRKREAWDDTRSLARLYPDVAAAIPLLHTVARTSQLVTSVTARHDPTVSERVAFGKARKTSSQDRRPPTVDVVALVAGDVGDSLRLVLVRDEPWTWHKDDTTSLGVPRIVGEDGGAWWQSSGGPIRQVCFSQHGQQPGSWMAVRSSSSTDIFRPLYHHAPTRSSASSNKRKSAFSRLDVNHVARVSSSKTGGSPHADVDFDPWQNGQFTILDQHGAWTVWTMQSQLGHGLNPRAVMGPRGFVDDPPGPKVEGLSPLADGWGSIFWVLTGHALLVCRRREMVIFDLESKVTSRITQFFRLGRTNWIIDLKRTPFDENQFVVVTSSHLFLMEVGDVSPVKGLVEQRIKPDVLLTWNHFRHAEDISLRVHISFSRDDSLMLLHSHYNQLVTLYRFKLPKEPWQTPCSVSDPYDFDVSSRIYSKSELKSGQDLIRTSQAPSDLRLCPLPYITTSPAHPSDLGSMYANYGVTFLKIFVLCHDLTFRALVYHTRVSIGGGRSDGQSGFRSIEMPTVKQVSPWSHQRSASKVVEDPFIVDDAMAESSEADSTSSEVPRQQQGRYVGGDSSQEVPEYMDMSAVYEHAFAPDRFQQLRKDWTLFRTDKIFGSSESENYVVHEDLTAIEEKVEAKEEVEHPPVETLLEIHPPVFRPSDVREHSDNLGKLFRSLVQDEPQADVMSLAITSLISPAYLQLPPASPSSNLPTLKTMYDHLIDTYLVPLPLTIPGPTRVSLERSLRAVAYELCLSSIGVRLVRPPELTPPAPPSQPHVFALPVRRKARSRSTSRSRLRIASSPGPVLPAIHSSSPPQAGQSPGPQPGPSAALSSSPPIPSSLTQPAPPTESPASIRLRALTTLTPQPPLSRTASALLTQWVPGGDPSLHSWDTARRGLGVSEFEDDDDDDDDDEKRARARHRRRRRDREEARRQRRQRGDPRGTLVPPTVWSGGVPPPTTTSVSQPATSRLGDVGGSSQMTATTGGGEEDGGRGGDEGAKVAMSQVERGVFGGRDAGMRVSFVRSRKKRGGAKLPGFR